MIKTISINKTVLKKTWNTKYIGKTHSTELCSWSWNMLCVCDTQLPPHLMDELLLVCTVFLLEVYSMWLPPPHSETTCAKGKRGLTKGSWSQLTTFGSFWHWRKDQPFLLLITAGLPLFLEHVLCWAAVCPGSPSVTERVFQVFVPSPSPQRALECCSPSPFPLRMGTQGIREPTREILIKPVWEGRPL